jgi:hypothetical protein
VVPGSVASGLDDAVWLERSGAGPRRVFSSLRAGPVSAEGQDASSVAHGSDPYRELAAWSEPDVAGGRAIRVLDLKYGTAPETLPRLADGAVADEPAITVRSPGFRPFEREWLAWVEAPPGGIPQLRVSSLTTALPELGNADPAVAAAQPAIWQEPGTLAVAWVEGGRVLARVLGGAYDGPATDFGIATLNADPSRAAREPRFETHPGWWGQPIVYFVEDAGDRDVVRARRWSGSAWEALPDVSAGFDGRITALSARFRTITWTDAEGRVWVRECNG